MNSEFSVFVYILSLLAINQNERLTSSQISDRIHIHSARIRKVLGVMKRYGFVETKEGIAGGYILSKKPENIHLKDVYTMVESKPLQIPKRSLNEELSLPTTVDASLEYIFFSCEKQMLKHLEKIKLSDIIEGGNLL
ncbi:hypothetical protein C0Q44_25195 [Paenibacillus sp. PCH8]|uniref:Rrf2 family transcriptional regulator n=1 Tax=Paenibacillus sp. PCH8 TaxID=2066524 RepID=UPI000CF8C728|nr:Rrf2 family transcriptional regulator [Paenibacillus sp. PCH8]PQP81021.1 hypothetical protein C0Q44_25195 [Paenibacillus sp. PCH8]